MGTNGVSGSGNNFQIPNLWIKPNLNAGKTVQSSNSVPINMKFTNVGRENLGLVNPYNNADATISGAREIATKTNDIMAQLGYPNFKVTSKAVVSVTNGVNGKTLPALNIADDNAVMARVADPKGPFSELFT